MATGLIVLAALAAYHNSFVGTFVLDDVGAILENGTIRQLWSIWTVLSPPSGRGETVAGRPLLNVSLAVNYALGGLNVWGYHAANLAIHVAAALLLFGILRRTLLLPALQGRFRRAATPLALAGALVWTVHPLQTESVTYIAQRAESLAGLFYLLTLYCVIRGAGSGTVPLFAAHSVTLPSAVVGEKGDCPPSPPQPAQTDAGETPALRWQGEKGDRPPRPISWLWYVAAVSACLLGMATKEIMVTAPLIVLLYDSTFLSGSFREALRRRWGLYLGLAATWGLLAYLVFSTGLIGRQSGMGAPDVWGYARSQPGVILHYLGLSLWPSRLCISYGWPVANTPLEVLPGAFIVGSLLIATLWGLAGRRTWAFLGAWFFLVLAPTSSIMPLNQLAQEHRMYLSLAAVVVLVVAGGYVLWDALWDKIVRRAQLPFSPTTTWSEIGLSQVKQGKVAGLPAALRWAAPVVVLAALLTTLGYLTQARNRDYRSLLAIWQDTVNKCPANPLARNNLGNALAIIGNTDEALKNYAEALRAKPTDHEAHYNLGTVLSAMGRTDEAIGHYRQALQMRPGFAEAHNNLAASLAQLGRTDEAIDHYRQALRWRPNYFRAHYNLARVLTGAGQTVEAIEHYNQCLQLMPDSTETLGNLAWLLATSEPAAGGDAPRAIRLARRACELAGQENAECLDTLAAAYAAAAQFADAVATAEHARQLAESAGQTALAEGIQARLELYRAARPYCQRPTAP